MTISNINISNFTYKEMMAKADRPYLHIIVSVNSELWAIPFRSNISSKRPNQTYYPLLITSKSHCTGLDFSKALPITDSDILDTKDHISSEEYTIVKNNYESICSRFERYLLRAIKLNNKGILEKQALYRYSTLTEILKKDPIIR